MELQQRFSVSMNEYEESEGTQRGSVFQTEDVYQSLQYQPTAAQKTNNSTKQVSEHCERKYLFILFAINILISTTILAIVGLNYSQNKKTQPVNGEKEVWLLYDNVFYLFWSERTDCIAAESFCSKRNARLAMLSVHNKVWLMSRTNGKQFLVSKASSDGSGDIASPFTDDEDHECGIMTSDVEVDHAEGFVCERIMKPIGTAFREFPA
ncbi:uncharacterized protein LOC125268211 [Megalobrama amblycephala]|uniref:uncharacterized protein LOC125268211 n=1 Tax=Megalobrama amblycephala TaxID=75352 RepID=UPI0020145E69|nr:uncharacterized protein LOC125268211 [Megalobrama amblycephala]